MDDTGASLRVKTWEAGESPNNNQWSQVVTHPSTNQTQCCLTSLIRREAVFATWYGRWPKQTTNRRLEKARGGRGASPTTPVAKKAGVTVMQQQSEAPKRRNSMERPVAGKTFPRTTTIHKNRVQPSKPRPKEETATKQEGRRQPSWRNETRQGRSQQRHTRGRVGKNQRVIVYLGGHPSKK